MRLLVYLVAGVILSGCQTVDRHAALPPSLPKVAQSLKKRCPTMLNLPDRALNEEETAAALAWFRLHYGACARKDGKLIDATTILENLGRKP